MRLESGHNLLLLAVTISRGDTSADVEAKVVAWFADVLELDPPGLRQIRTPNADGEYVVGPANPVTVIPMLDSTLDAARGGFCAGPENRREVISTTVPSPGAVAVKVHVDWHGASTVLQAFWRDGFFGWVADADQPDLVVQAVCFDEQPVRPPTEEPPVFELPRLPSLPETQVPLTLLAVGGLVMLLGFQFIRKGK